MSKCKCKYKKHSEKYDVMMAWIVVTVIACAAIGTISHFATGLALNTTDNSEHSVIVNGKNCTMQEVRND